MTTNMTSGLEEVCRKRTYIQLREAEVQSKEDQFHRTYNARQVTENKVEAMAAAPKPKNAAEVRSFRGSGLFSSNFIPDFATITQPSWELTHNKTKWKWTKEEQRAFGEVKGRLTKAPIMAYYRLDADTRIVTDASPVGLGAVLQQKQEDVQYKPVQYASRKLRDAETRFSLFEREALVVKWACDKFHLCLYDKV